MQVVISTAVFALLVVVTIIGNHNTKVQTAIAVIENAVAAARNAGNKLGISREEQKQMATELAAAAKIDITKPIFNVVRKGAVAALDGVTMYEAVAETLPEQKTHT
jgi:hypothetical protein